MGRRNRKIDPRCSTLLLTMIMSLPRINITAVHSQCPQYICTFVPFLGTAADGDGRRGRWKLPDCLSCLFSPSPLSAQFFEKATKALPSRRSKNLQLDVFLTGNAGPSATLKSALSKMSCLGAAEGHPGFSLTGALARWYSSLGHSTLAPNQREK